MYVFDTLEEASRGFVGGVERVLESAKPDEGVICSTGKTFESIYDIMAGGRDRFSELLEGLFLISQDELMGIAEDDPISYTRYMRERLIRTIGLHESKWVIPNPTMAPLEALRIYIRKLEAIKSVRLAMLGIGPDSDPENGLPASPHVGFITPGTPLHVMAQLVQLDETTRSVNSSGHPNDYPPLAITNGPANILRAMEILPIATGSRKQQNMKRILLGGFDSQVPTTLLHLISRDVPGWPEPRVSYYMDRDAAGATLDELELSSSYD